ncbi:RICIN domain-containing protein [Streptomyces sp. TRM S81-3]|uniref:RICIN domain-containing protein n=1 Tax=Streptomyces griseicoloratus TaxID=2752516 RepID=A0A926L5M7_9ACTN|nr:RICIN domain-containing protein [Streptomyces griseicoloratus]MBD0421859.1 RICIN domain-containing protein [Streptomyces griseicoloratus]
MNRQSRARLLVSALAAALVAALVPSYAAAQPSGTSEAAGGRLGDATGFTADGDTYTVTAGDAELRISFPDDDLFRVHLAPDGRFSDPANDDPEDPDAPDADIVVKNDYQGARSTHTETDDAYVIRTDEATLTVTKSPVTLALADEDGRQLWRETAPLAWSDDGTVQTLRQGEREQFFGGGMQNGSFSHRGETIDISRDYDWNEGGNPNAAPFYLSSNGYGVLRNTFAPGRYDFGAPVRTTHAEQRFDAYYFVGDAKDVIDGYTELTGRPALLPMYALEIGDADCYLHNANRGERETLRDSREIAAGYAERGIPLGWMLVNDGYGCGYEDLPETGDMLHGHGAELGLWTEADLTEQESEVAAGVRVRKTDVAWVGPGYRFALDACEKARDGIERHSRDRATVLTIEGWAGTQRCGAMWSGDQSGSWDYIRWQIPTYAGATMSGQAVTTGDIDGIFGGSAETYVRDLQWKMLLPMTYGMSGWAASDKQPWRYGEPYTEINKKYLLLHERLLPYFSTHLANAARNGVGPTRPLYLNYPDDPATWGDRAKYQFLAGDDFLVAPVYEDSDVRDGIHLPEGRWVDYWTGRVHEGGRTLDGYRAPLDTLPLFVRAGAIVPMFPEGTTDWAQGKKAGRLDLDVYPEGDSSFTLHEDDGRTRDHATGQSAAQKIEVSAPDARRRGPVEIRIGELRGAYDGKPVQRRYGLTVHTDTAPSGVRAAGQRLREVASERELGTAPSGWYYDGRTGVVHVKTAEVPTGERLTVRIDGAGSVGGTHPQDRAVGLDATTAAVGTVGRSQQVEVAFTNDTGKPVTVTGTAVDAPEGWKTDAAGPTGTRDLPDGATFTARFTVTPADEARPGKYEVSATASYATRNKEYTVRTRTGTTLAHPSLASAADNVGVTRQDDPAPGDIDGGGSSFIAERLAAKGVSPGATVAANGFTFTWPDAEPGTPDNVTGKGQTIKVSGQQKGNALAFLGTGTSGSAEGTATVHYTDGTATEAKLGFPNWCCLPADRYGAKTAITTKGKNTPSGPAYETVEYRLYTKTLRIDPGKEVAAVTLPANSAVHVFALDVGDEEIVPPPVPDGQYALATTGGGGRLEAPGDTGAGRLRIGQASTSPAQKWNVTRDDDGTYQLKNAGSGLCADVAASSQASGAEVVQYTCTGTANQRWTVTEDQGTLTLRAKHSGLSLTATADGLVVQATDDGGARQRWRATAT